MIAVKSKFFAFAICIMFFAFFFELSMIVVNYKTLSINFINMIHVYIMHIIKYFLAPPSCPLNVRATNITSKSVTLNWSPPTTTGGSELTGENTCANKT